MSAVPHPDPSPVRNAAVLLALAALGLAAVTLAGCDRKAPEAAPTVEGVSAAEVATDWTVENPTEPAVPVVLPTVQLTNAPTPVSTAPPPAAK